ncbi:MAG: PASTA domain-containing protein [Candidatus Neomarinimicrobiota bacterium]
MIHTLFRYAFALTLFSIMGILALDALVLPRYTLQGESRYLMNVRGQSLEEAQANLELEGFKGVVYDSRYSNEITPGTVLDQYPVPNTKVKPGRTIRLTISEPEKMVKVPSLLGHSHRSAELELQQVGLVIDTVYSEYNPDYPKGTVAWQYPKGGDNMQKGLGVQITLSLGTPPNFFEVPDLFGLSLTKARENLTKARLRLGKVSYRQNEDLIPYTVLDQSIPAETVLDRSQPIDLTVSVLNLIDILHQLTGDQ